MTTQPDEIEKILDLFAKWTINNVEHGIYIPLPSPETHQAITTMINEAQTNAVAWTIMTIDDLHINHTDTMQMSNMADQTYKGIKNTIRDRYKNEVGIDPAPNYPINVTLSKPIDGGTE
jgi:hypothetical protein